MNSFYYLGHFSKFIRPGAKRIGCSSNDDMLQATAFLNTDGSIASVIQNMTGNDKEYFVWINNKALRFLFPAHSIMTVVLK
jgi:glucosylceramidase